MSMPSSASPESRRAGRPSLLTKVGILPALVVAGAALALCVSVGTWVTLAVVVLVTWLALGLWPVDGALTPPVPARVVLALLAPLASGVVAVTGEERWVLWGAGPAFALLVIVELLLAPTPRDHTDPSTRGGRRAVDAHDLTAEESWTRASTTASLSAGVLALLVLVSGTGWVALAAHVDWEFAVPVAALTALVVAAMDVTVGVRHLPWLAVLAGPATGALVMAAERGPLSGWVLVPDLFPTLARRVGPDVSALVFGALVGLAVVLVVRLVRAVAEDALAHGDGEGGESAPRPDLTALAPAHGVALGCVGFLLAGFAVYVVTRIGAL